jgi:hypothetical protein
MKNALLTSILCLFFISGFAQESSEVEMKSVNLEWAKADHEIEKVDREMKNIDRFIQEKLKSIDTTSEFYNLKPEKPNFKYQKDKKITKQYNIGSDCNLFIDNRFGQIKIENWDKSEISFAINITVGANKEKNIDKLINSIEVDFSQKGNTVSAKTSINNGPKAGEYLIEINYKVYAPKNVKLNLTNIHGDISIGESMKPASIEVKFGNFSANKMGKGKITCKYGEVNIIEANDLNLQLQYCNNSEIKSIKQLNGKLSYSSVSIKSVDEADIILQYSDTHIEKAGKIKLGSNFSDFTIGYLSEHIRDTHIGYGDLIIKEVSPDFSEIKVKANYSEIILGLGKQTDFSYHFKTNYAEIKSDLFNLKKQSDRYIEQENKLEAFGKFGGKGNSIVDINGNFSDIYIK